VSLSNPAALDVMQSPHAAVERDALTRDYDAITRAAGITVLPDRLMVRISGDDRAPFMHGMCSNDVTGLATGALEPALILTERAHVIAELYLYATADALILEVDRERWPATRAYIEKFLVADDVEIEELDDLGMVDVEGPKAATAVDALAGDAAAGTIQAWRHAEFAGMRVANLPRLGGPGFTLTVARDRIPALVAELCERNRALGISEVGDGVREIIRVENGMARVGVDTTDKTIALEARLGHAISFAKGCYLGQETIERATARGGLKKRLFGLRIGGQRAPAADSAIMLDGKEVGRLSSVVRSPRVGLIGLGILHHSAWSVGTRVTIAGLPDAITASVSDLPFG
jgi:folate-binding protein YgfZ